MNLEHVEPGIISYDAIMAGPAEKFFFVWDGRVEKRIAIVFTNGIPSRSCAFHSLLS